MIIFLIYLISPNSEQHQVSPNYTSARSPLKRMNRTQMYLISLNTATVVNMGQSILPETLTSFHVKVGKSLGKIPIACPGSVMN